MKNLCYPKKLRSNFSELHLAAKGIVMEVAGVTSPPLRASMVHIVRKLAEEVEIRLDKSCISGFRVRSL